jgi:hypothetical protein
MSSSKIMDIIDFAKKVMYKYIYSFHGNEYSYCCLLGYNDVYFCRWVKTFHRNIMSCIMKGIYSPETPVGTQLPDYTVL